MTRGRSFVSLLALLLLLATLAAFPRGAGAAPQNPGYDPETILVGWDRGLPDKAKADVHRSQRSEVANRFDSIDVDVVRVPKGHSAEDWVTKYERHPKVAFAELNHEVAATSIPSETLFRDQWGFHNTGQSVTGSLVRGTNDWDIDAPEAWDKAYGPGNFPSSGGTRVAVIDTGVDLAHIDLLAKVKACASALAAIGLVTEGACSDDNFHGTHVAGTVAANTNNGVGVAGTAPDAELAIFKALNAAGSGFVADVVAGIDWAWKRGGAKIISMSLGSESSSSTEQRAVREATSNGILVIAAAGNGWDSKPNYPAYYSEVMSVASFNQAGAISPFSTCNGDVEIAAPGEDIWSTFPENTYGVISGTSMATPHVSGAAALVMSELGLSAEQTRSKLKSTAVGGLSTGGRKECASYPALNLAAALGGASGGGSTPPPSTGPGSLTGTVTDQKAKSGVGGATVDCGSAGKATTASNGSYSIANIAPGGYSCTASASGYKSKTQSVTISSGQATASNFALQQAR